MQSTFFVHRQMEMVVLAIKLHPFSFKVVTDTGKDALHIAEHLFGEELSPVFLCRRPSARASGIRSVCRVEYR